jgi:hypothetical protein
MTFGIMNIAVIDKQPRQVKKARKPGNHEDNVERFNPKQHGKPARMRYMHAIIAA